MSDTMIALLLGFIEGLTEFLPVSSTGHLILAGELVGFTDNSSVAFKIAIQLGAILAVLLVYWRRFWAVGTGLLKREAGAVAFTRNILLGFAPALVIGVVAYDAIRAAMQTPEIVAIALIVGGILILVLERVVKTVRFHAVEEIPFGTALSIGLVQCTAMLPGVSRSGATIMGGLMMGVERKTAAEFSFMLAIPTMFAASFYSLWKVRAEIDPGAFGQIAVGFIAAFIVAFITVRAVLALIGRIGFTPFGYYRIALGTLMLIVLAIR
jgi:undecaprenyl-diphosphatase